MTVKELIEELLKAPQDALVVCQKDGEGNDYSPCRGADYEGTQYVADTRWNGTVYSALDISEGHGSGEPLVPCVVIFPVN